jgi:hypothetical protein
MAYNQILNQYDVAASPDPSGGSGTSTSGGAVFPRSLVANVDVSSPTPNQLLENNSGQKTWRLLRRSKRWFVVVSVLPGRIHRCNSGCRGYIRVHRARGRNRWRKLVADAITNRSQHHRDRGPPRWYGHQCQTSTTERHSHPTKWVERGHDVRLYERCTLRPKGEWLVAYGGHPGWAVLHTDLFGWNLADM